MPTWLQVIAVNLPVDEISGMREMFLEIDKDRSGTITVEEFALVGAGRMV
jgi:calcium-dependent protein kinase